ncbi:MAG: class I SAM-dependent methyltransferase [Myxococcales bacterium]|nr:class I SAM-dependent methyltransferase [Myxococcales bacterium]
MSERGEIDFSDEELGEQGIELATSDGRRKKRSLVRVPLDEVPRAGNTSGISTRALAMTVRQAPFSTTDLIVEAAFEKVNGAKLAQKTIGDSPWDDDSEGVERHDPDDPLPAPGGDELGFDDDLPGSQTVVTMSPAAPAPAQAALPPPLPEDEAPVVSSSPAPDLAGPRVAVAERVSGQVSRGRASVNVSKAASGQPAPFREPEIEADEEFAEEDLEEVSGPSPQPPQRATQPMPLLAAPAEERKPAPEPVPGQKAPSLPPPVPAVPTVIAPAAGVAARAPQSPPSVPPPAPGNGEEKPRRKRRAKQWFEEIFDEDYLCTLPYMTPRQTERESAFILDALKIQSPATLLDIGCGYGRHAMELAARGHQVTGLDLSLPLLIRAADAARRGGVNVNFVHGDMREMAFDGEYDAAYCFFTTYGYFDDDSNRQVAAHVSRALKPGGRFLLDIVNRDYLIGDLPARVWWQGEGCVVLEEVDFNYFTSRLQVHRSIVFEDGRQTEQDISIRAYSLHEIGKVLHHAGFRVIEVSGGLSLRGRFFGPEARQILVVAEKKEPGSP